MCSTAERTPVGRRAVLGAVLGGAAAPFGNRLAKAQTAAPLRIGVLGDFSGPYSAISGEGTVAATRFAIADYGGSVLGRPIEVVAADHLNKPDTGMAIAREWLGPGHVSMITDVTNSSIALGLQTILPQFRALALYTTVGNPDLVGKACSPFSAVWTRDQWSSTVAPIRASLQAGQRKFFLIVADYAFGKTLEGNATDAIAEGGGNLLGVARHPLNSADFSSYLLSAQASGADVVMLLNGGQDLVNCYKQAVEFRLPAAQTFYAPILFLSDIHALGLTTGAGLRFVQTWYWNLNDTTRAWADRFYKQRGSMPGDSHAATYSAVLSYLRAVNAAGTDEPASVMHALKTNIVSDMFTSHGVVRADGRLVFDEYLVQVKRPAESTRDWDYLTITGTVPAAEASRSLESGGCRLT
jgi:branched-chain amino acid transport system substrate-binding protein